MEIVKPRPEPPNLRVVDESAWVKRSASVTCKDDRKIVVAVPVAVRDRPAVDNHAVVQQIGIAFLGGLQFFKEVAEAFDEIVVNP